MKVKFLLFLFVLISIELSAQDYLLSFSANGAVSSIDSIQVNNLTQGTFVTIVGSDELRLIEEVQDIPKVGLLNLSEVNIFPNPVTDKSSIIFNVENSGNIIVDLFDLSGNRVVSIQKEVSVGIQKFTLIGLKSGVYIVKVQTKNRVMCGKILSQNIGISCPSISYEGTLKTDIFSKNSPQTVVQMQFNDGDTLFLRSFSGKFITNDTLMPTQGTNVTINFAQAVDFDGNSYPTVQIGSQIWMAQNLRVTHYSNGDAIPEISDYGVWANLDDNNIDDAFCWFDNDTSNAIPYGALYTWAAAMGDNAVSSGSSPSGVQGICPNGWHLPSDNEFTQLANYLGGWDIAGGKLKDTNSVYWNNPNEDATNETGFAGIGSGYRYDYKGDFADLKIGGYWWTSTENPSNTSDAFIRDLLASGHQLLRYDFLKSHGYSVRCVRD